MKSGCWMPCQGTDGYYGSQGPGINRLSARVSRHMAALILRPETANRRPRTCLALLGSAPMWEVAASFPPLFLLFSSSLFPSSSTPGSWPPFLSFYRRQNVRRVARYPLSLRCPCPGTGANDQQPGDDRGECPTYFRGRFWAVGDGLGARTLPSRVVVNGETRSWAKNGKRATSTDPTPMTTHLLSLSNTRTDDIPVWLDRFHLEPHLWTLLHRLRQP